MRVRSIFDWWDQRRLRKFLYDSGASLEKFDRIFSSSGSLQSTWEKCTNGSWMVSYILNYALVHPTDVAVLKSVLGRGPTSLTLLLDDQLRLARIVREHFPRIPVPWSKASAGLSRRLGRPVFHLESRDEGELIAFEYLGRVVRAFESDFLQLPAVLDSLEPWQQAYRLLDSDFSAVPVFYLTYNNRLFVVGNDQGGQWVRPEDVYLATNSVTTIAALAMWRVEKELLQFSFLQHSPDNLELARLQKRFQELKSKLPRVTI